MDNMPKPESKLLTLFLTVAMVASRLTTYVTSPLWLDALRINDTNETYIHNNESCDYVEIDRFTSNVSTSHQVDPYFIVLCQALVPTVVFGVSLVFLLVGCPNRVTEADRTNPKKYFLFTGVAQAVSSLMINYALSGTRSPPYLIALLGNFLVPIQFVVRFLLLHKLPSRRKLLCAVSVVLAEFVCLLPSIFPGLETSQSHKQDGGATGTGEILFPLSFVMALVPGTLVNSLMERSVKNADHNKNSPSTDVRHLNMVFYLFSFHLAFLLVTLAFFWVDVIPGYGISKGITGFSESIRFNFLCLLGLEGCHSYVVMLGWITLLVSSASMLINSYLLRHSEGANYVMVAMTLRSPLLFLFWTLFDEHPFKWAPHISLSTWLSIGALFVMVPAVHLYNTGSSERTIEGFDCCPKLKKVNTDDMDPLIQDQGNVQYPE